MFEMTEIYGNRTVIAYFDSLSRAVTCFSQRLYRKDMQKIDIDHLPDTIMGMQKCILIRYNNFIVITGVPFPNWTQHKKGIPNASVVIKEINFTPESDQFYQVIFKSSNGSDINWELVEGFVNSYDELIEHYNKDSRPKEWLMDENMIDYDSPYLTIKRCILIGG